MPHGVGVFLCPQKVITMLWLFPILGFFQLSLDVITRADGRLAFGQGSQASKDLLLDLG